jgi:hypothetical protein
LSKNTQAPLLILMLLKVGAIPTSEIPGAEIAR